MVRILKNFILITLSLALLVGCSQPNSSTTQNEINKLKDELVAFENKVDEYFKGIDFND